MSSLWKDVVKDKGWTRHRKTQLKTWILLSISFFNKPISACILHLSPHTLSSIHSSIPFAICPVTLPVCVGWWIPLGEHFLWDYDPYLAYWHWLGAQSCPRALGRGCCNWGPGPPAWTESHQRHGGIWSGAGCWPGSGDEGWSGLWNGHPDRWKKNMLWDASQHQCHRKDTVFIIASTVHISLHL